MHASIKSFPALVVSPLRSRSLLVIGTILSLATGAVSADPSLLNITCSPASLAWDTNAWIGVSITGSGLSTGAVVDLRLYVDVNCNGVVDPNDVWLTELRVQDGVTNAWGSSVIVSDTNGSPDAIITTRVSYHGTSDMAALWHATGNYLWEARLTNDSASAVAAFTVTQPTSTKWLAGTACVLTNLETFSGQPKPGTLVILDYASLLDGFPPATWTDTNGAFRIYLPEGISTALVNSVSAVGIGYLMSERGPGDEPLSTLQLTNSLHSGANLLSRPLYVVPITPEISKVSGRVTDNFSQPVHAALVQTDMDNGDMWALALTDTNGVYQFPFAGSDEPVFVGAYDHFVNMRGFVGSGTQLVSILEDKTNVNICLQHATTLIRGTVLNSGTTDGAPGVRVEAGNEEQGGTTFTFDSNGVFELGAVESTNWTASVDSDSLQPLHRFPVPEEGPPFELQASGIYSGPEVQFEAVPAWVLSGHVFQNDGFTPLTGCRVCADYPVTGDWQAESQAGIDGAYSLLLPNGDYVVRAKPTQDDFPFVDQYYSNSNGRAEATVLTVSNEDVTPINFVLEQCAIICGRVMAEGKAMTNVQVEARLFTPDHEQGVAWARTDTNGNYILKVPPDIAYGVCVQLEGSTWLRQYFSNVIDRASATLVTPTLLEPASGIDFQLQRGGTISGYVFQEDGFTPLANCRVCADDPVTGEWRDEDQTDIYGAYSLLLPGGDYVVRAKPTQDDFPFLDQWYSNSVSRADATPVRVVSPDDTPDVNFTLRAGARISGHIWGGGSIVSNAGVSAFELVLDESNTVVSWNSRAAAKSDSGGYYSLLLAPGHLYAVMAEGPDETFWLYQIYSNTTDMAQAVRLTPDAENPIEGIDFHLVEGATFGGHLSNAVGGEPLSQVRVDLFQADGSDNFHGVSMTFSRDDGNFRIHVPEGSNYVLRAGVGGQWVPRMYASGRELIDGTRIKAVTGEALLSLNLELDAGMTISGRVSDRYDDGMNSVCVSFGDIDGEGKWTWRYDTYTDPSGNYEYALRANSNHFLRIAHPGGPTVYYNQTLTPSRGQGVSGGQGTIISNVNFQIFASNEDSDNDSVMDDIEAYVMHTNPWGGHDYLKCTTISFTNGKTAVSWCSVPGTDYTVERTTNLLNVAAWINLTPTSLTATTTNTTYQDNPAPLGGMYRIGVPY